MTEQVQTMADARAAGKEVEVLFWVGCAGSFDARAQRVTRAMAGILSQAGVSFAVLGNEEMCTGDPARRAGNEFLFQMLAIQNIQTLNMYEVRRIITACPHCFNTLKNEYPELGGTYEVMHHTQFINTLIEEGRLKIEGGTYAGKKITYHDSCYLGRINGEYTAPRKLIEQLDADLTEMKRCKTTGLCCGAGGAQMFKEDEPGKKRISTERAEEALATGPEVVVANCPFCITMLTDGIKSADRQEEVMVLDISEMILQDMHHGVS
jgi:Fe-S oxidoreductase